MGLAAPDSGALHKNPSVNPTGTPSGCDWLTPLFDSSETGDEKPNVKLQKDVNPVWR
jgi:hypothetical protein